MTCVNAKMFVDRISIDRKKKSLMTLFLGTMRRRTFRGPIFCISSPNPTSKAH